MPTEGHNRWWYDGYRARHNGKPRNANPFSSPVKAKWRRWDEGWECADNQIRGMTEWDQEQDMINQLIEEISDG